MVTGEGCYIVNLCLVVLRRDCVVKDPRLPPA